MSDERLTFQEFIAKVAEEYLPSKPSWFTVKFLDPSHLVTPEMCPVGDIWINLEYYPDKSDPSGYDRRDIALYLITFGHNWIHADDIPSYRLLEAYREMDHIRYIAMKYRNRFLNGSTATDIAHGR